MNVPQAIRAVSVNHPVKGHLEMTRLVGTSRRYMQLTRDGLLTVKVL